MSIYVVDSNFFIQAHRETYPLDVVPSFWRKVKQLAEEGRIISIDKVKNEIFRVDDELKTWCVANLPEDFFKATLSIMASYAQVSIWAASRSGHYLPRALNEFLDAEEADAFIVAYALADAAERVIVTQEISEPNRKNKVKIPEACNGFHISYVNTIEMFRQLGETF
jgi:hypothetical protein